MEDTLDKAKEHVSDVITDVTKKKLLETPSKSLTESSRLGLQEIKETETSGFFYGSDPENKIVLKYFRLGVSGIDKVLDFDQGRFFQNILMVCYAKIHPAKEAFSAFSQTVKKWFKDMLGVEIDFLKGGWLSTDKLIFFPKFYTYNASDLDIPEIDLPQAIVATCQDYCLGILGGKGIYVDQIKRPSLLKQACAKLIATIVTFIYYSPQYTSEIDVRKRLLDALLAITKHLNDAVEFDRVQNQSSQSFTYYLNKCQHFIDIAQKKILESQQPKLRLMPWLALYYKNADKLIRNLPLYILRLIHYNLKVPDGLNFELSRIFKLYMEVVKNKTIRKQKIILTTSRIKDILSIINKAKQSLLKSGRKANKQNLKQLVKKGDLTFLQAGYYLDYVLNETNDIHKILEGKSEWILNGDQFLRELIYNPVELLKSMGEDKIDILKLYTKDEHGLALLRLNVLMPCHLLENELNLHMGNAEFLLLMREVIHPVLIDFSDITTETQEINPLLAIWKPGIFTKISSEEKNTSTLKARNDYFKLICTLMMVGTELSAYCWFIKALIKMGEFAGSPYAATIYQKTLKQLAERTLECSLDTIFQAIKLENSFELSSRNILGSIKRTKEIQNWTDVRAKMTEQPFYKELLASHDALHTCCNQIELYVNKHLIVHELKEWKKMDEKLRKFAVIMQDQLPKMDTYLANVEKYNEKLRSFIITLHDQLENPLPCISEPLPIEPISDTKLMPSEVMMREGDAMLGEDFGNSIFHALLGRWNDELSAYVCNLHTIYHHKKNIHLIIKTTKSETLKKLIMESIWEQIISCRKIGKYSGEWIRKYQKFLMSSDGFNPEYWEKFQKVLQRYPMEILACIIAENRKNFSKDKKNTKEIKSTDKNERYHQFQYALLSSKFDLYGRIQMIPELCEAFYQYHYTRQEQFLLTHPFSDELMTEYADFVITSGNLLSFSALKIISYILEIILIYKDTSGLEKRINADLPFETVKFLHFNKADYFTSLSDKHFQEKEAKLHERKRDSFEKCPALQALGIFRIKKSLAEEKEHSEKDMAVLTLKDKEIFRQLLKDVKSETYLWDSNHIESYKKLSQKLQTNSYKNKIAKQILQKIEAYLQTLHQATTFNPKIDSSLELIGLKKLLDWVSEILKYDKQWIQYVEIFKKKITPPPAYPVLMKSISAMIETLSQHTLTAFYLKQVSTIRKIRQSYIAHVSISKDSCKGLEIREMDDEIYEFDEIEEFSRIYGGKGADKEGMLRALCLQGRILSMYPFQGEREHYALCLIEHIMISLGGLWRGVRILSEQAKTVRWRLEEMLFSHLPDNADDPITRELIRALLAKGLGVLSYFDMKENCFVCVSLSSEQNNPPRVSLRLAKHIVEGINQLYQLDCAIAALPRKNITREDKLEENSHYQRVMKGFDKIEKMTIAPQTISDFEVSILPLDEDIPMYETVVESERIIFRPGSAIL